MRNSIYRFLNSPIVIVLSILISATFTYFTGGLGYFFGMSVALIFLWAGKFKWSEFGIGKPDWGQTIIRSILLAITIFIIIDIIIQPIVEIYLGTIELSSLNGIKGNFINYIAFIMFMWIVAAFGEEFLYRGFFMKQFAKILGNTNKAWFISVLAISILFGMAHIYQGVSGMITTGLVGLILSFVFYKNRKNLVLVMLIHGFYDMIGLTLIFLNHERVILDCIKENIMK